MSEERVSRKGIGFGREKMIFLSTWVKIGQNLCNIMWWANIDFLM